VCALEEAPRLAYARGALSETRHANITGPERLARLNEALDGFGYTRHKGQRNFHRNMTMAIIRKLYKDDFPEHIDSLREQLQTDVFKPEVLIITPRRWGKTWAVAMFVAACAYAIEGTSICIFSTGKRASTSMLEQVHKFLVKLPDIASGAMPLLKHNAEMIQIQGPYGPDDIRTIKSFPSKVRCPIRPNDHPALLLLPALRAGTVRPRERYVSLPSCACLNTTI